jgi:hypothetical protein
MNNPGFVFIQGGLTGTSYESHFTLDPSHSYKWKMWAVNGAGSSPWSAWAFFDY